MLVWDLMPNYWMQLMISWITCWRILDAWYALNIPKIKYVQCLSHKSLQKFSPISSTNFRSPHFGHPDHSGTPCWSKKTSLRAHTRSFWEQVKRFVWGKIQCYSFSHNHGNGKWQCLKGKYYWRHPIVHFHDYVVKGKSSPKHSRPIKTSWTNY